ncbi:type III secretion system inner membrane ring subunit SctD [Pandoraea sp. PE-S2T-3]|uniref:type III secretion system inner membrane ring subunit SctD n=1 Tax=Pandoraea sp. PE-S2T-3 TaxID=1986993 RepID=UPI000B3FDA15|nr:type III secretion system inner membrane ring subunit SctD [Pandoraea sp. PE-S2T-3]
MTTTYTLTLLDGPLAGRSLPLPSGAFSVGAEDSDIAMALENGAGATLHVDDDGVRLLTRTDVWVNGASLEWPDDTLLDVPLCVRLPLRSVIDLAGLGIWLDTGDAESPVPMPLPQRPARLASDAVHPSAQRQAHTQPLLAQDGPAFSWSLKRKPSKRPRRATWLAATGISLVALAVGAMIWRTGSANVITSPGGIGTLKSLAARIAPGISLTISDGAVLFSGGCASDDVRSRLRTEARGLDKVVRDDTWCPADLTQSVQTLLRLYGYGAAYVGVAPSGEIVISGAFVADARWRATSDALDALALPHGWRVDNDEADGFDTVVQLLKDANQLRGVNVTRERDGWRLTGPVSAQRQVALQSLADTWNDAARTLRLRIEPLPVRMPTLSQTGLPAPVVSIGGSPTAPHITLADGTRLMQGARLAGGAHVIAVAADGVSIAAHDRLFYLPLTPENTYDDTPDED